MWPVVAMVVLVFVLLLILVPFLGGPRGFEMSAEAEQLGEFVEQLADLTEQEATLLAKIKDASSAEQNVDALARVVQRQISVLKQHRQNPAWASMNEYAYSQLSKLVKRRLEPVRSRRQFQLRRIAQLNDAQMTEQLTRYAAAAQQFLDEVQAMQQNAPGG